MFIKYEDFKSLGPLSSFIGGKLKKDSLINIETVVGMSETVYRVWYYNI